MYHKNEYSKETKFYDQFDNGGYHDKQLGEWLGAWMLVLNGNDYQGLIIFSLLFRVCANDPNVSQNDRQQVLEHRMLRH